MSDYRNLRILGVLGLVDSHSLTGDPIDRMGVERKMYEEQKLRGRLRHLEVNIAGQEYRFVLMRAPQEIGKQFSHKAKQAELFYIGLAEKNKKRFKRKKDEDK